MKAFLTLWLFFGLYFRVGAQSPRYTCYQKFIQEGRAAAQNAKSYQRALEKFNAARRCDPSKSDSVDIEINRLLDKILALKKVADSAETQARRERLNAGQKEKEARRAEAETNEIYRRVTSEQAKNKRMIDAFYFYNDTLALAVNKDKSGTYRYGFIDKEGNKRIAYKYEEASAFNQSDGYARVKENKVKYLLDAQGNEYRLAESLNEMDTTTTALDLHDQKLTVIPSVVFNYPKLKVLLLYRNPITVLPVEIGNLTSLESMDLSFTNVKSLPDEIGNLKNLQRLDLDYTQLENLPTPFWGLRNLQILDLTYTKLSLPDAIENLKNLRVLYVRECYFCISDPRKMKKMLPNCTIYESKEP